MNNRKRMMLRAVRSCYGGRLNKNSRSLWMLLTASEMAQEIHEILVFWKIPIVTSK